MNEKRTFKADFVYDPKASEEVHETIMRRDGSVEHSSKEAEQGFKETAEMCRKYVEGVERAAEAVHEKYWKGVIEDVKPVKRRKSK